MKTYINVQLGLDPNNYEPELKAVLSDLRKTLTRYDPETTLEYSGNVCSRWHVAGTVRVETR